MAQSDFPERHCQMETCTVPMERQPFFSPAFWSVETVSAHLVTFSEVVLAKCYIMNEHEWNAILEQTARTKS